MYYKKEVGCFLGSNFLNGFRFVMRMSGRNFSGLDVLRDIGSGCDIGCFSADRIGVSKDIIGFFMDSDQVFFKDRFSGS